MEKYPDHETYAKLYLRFYNPVSTRDLARTAEASGKTILDLCAGSGRLALEALHQGAEKVWLVEQEKEMVPRNLYSNTKITTSIGRVEEWMEWFIEKKKLFDAVVCQQAINYWLNDRTAGLVAGVLKDGGAFVFNTFNQKPSGKPAVREYEIEDKKFVETSWLVGVTVHHVQVREGMAPHTTSFQWLSTKHLMNILTPSFLVTVKTYGKTSVYRCVKKK